MTKLMEQAFAAASKLPASEQDVVAARWLEDIAAEAAWDESLAKSPDALADLAAGALAEFRAGKTLEQKNDDSDLSHE